jgi:DNA-binding protein Alba
MNENEIIIGKKRLIDYIDVIIVKIKVKNINEIKVLAKGRLISNAFEVVEVARQKFLSGKNAIEIKDIKCSSEIVNKQINGKNKSDVVPSIEITVVRKN